MRLLVIEDEPTLREQLCASLQADGFVVDQSGTGQEGQFYGEEYPIDLAIVDIGLPDISGIDVIKRWREGGVSFPVLILTARDRWEDKVTGLEIGADDYICKPFSPREVVARVRANLRRVAASQQDAQADKNYEQSPLVIDSKKMQVMLYDKNVALTAVEFRLLEKMASHPGQIFSRAQLIDASYEDNRIVSERTVDSHIKKLRKHLQDAAPDKAIIQSVYGVGYKVELDSEAWD